MRGQVAMVYALVGVIIFALIGIAMLPSLANTTYSAAYGGANATQPHNMSGAATAVTWLTPMIFATTIILTLLGVGLGAYAMMRR